MTTTPLGRTAVDMPAGDVVTLRRLARPLAFAAALATVPVYPVLFAATFVVLKLEPSWSPLQVVPRPLFLLALTVALLQAAKSLSFGRAIAGYFVGMAVLLLVEPLAALFMVLVTIGTIAWKSVRRRRIVAADWPALNGSMNVIATLTRGFL